MKYAIFIISLIAFCCEESDQVSLEKDVIIIDKFSVIEDSEMLINNAEIESDILTLSIQYGGGCGEIDYDLYTSGLFMESNPVQLEVVLSFEDNDTCEALITKDLSFDLEPVATLWKDSYQEASGTVIVRLKGYSDSIRYDF
ncbi:MAG: hypothetical protein ABJG78_07320 [Cyclobacteriaceae bacterium]